VGVYEVEYKPTNKKKPIKRYRVLIRKKNYKFDCYFDKKEDAVKENEKQLFECKNGFSDEKLKIAVYRMEIPTIEQALKVYYDNYLKFTKSFKQTENLCFRLIPNVFILVPKIQSTQSKFGYYWENISSQKGSRIRFGDFKIDCLDKNLIISYIAERSKVVKGSTLKKELNVLSGVFDYTTSELKFNFINPVNSLNRFEKPKILQVDKQEITADNHEKIKKELSSFRNPQMLQIYLFAYNTGLRISEILKLKFDDVDFENEIIKIVNTKNGKNRIFPLYEELKNFLNTLDNKTGKIFSYTQDGYKTNWQKMKQRTGINIRFHTTRREFISRVVNGTSLNSVQIAHLADIKKVDYLEREYKKDNIEEIRNKINQNQSLSINEIMQIVGHSQKGMTQHYSNVDAVVLLQQLINDLKN